MTLSQGDETSAVVEVNEELEKYLLFENSEGTVVVGFKKGAFLDNTFKRIMQQRNNLHLTARIVVRDLEKMRVSSGSTVNADTPIETDRVEVSVSSGSSASLSALKAVAVDFDLSSSSKVSVASFEAEDIRANISSAAKLTLNKAKVDRADIDASSASYVKIDYLTADKTNISTSSASRVSVSGNSAECIAHGSSGSKIDCESFNVGRARVELSSGSSGRLSVKDAIDISVSSGSSFIYYGTPTIIGTRVSSGGSVRQNQSL